jgi:hypothetical protein
MSFEREHAHDHAPTTRPDLDDKVAPGRRAVSSQLVASNHPVTSALIQRKQRDDSGVAADASAHVARAESSSGSELPGDLRTRFEATLGVDLSTVRVHTGTESASAAEAVGAKAYATGQDIHFAEGQYDPLSSRGQHLIAHEVAHTVQQRGAGPTRQHKLEVSAPLDTAEVEADRAADAMVSGTAAGQMSTFSGVARKVYREYDPSYGDLQGAGDEAEARAKSAVLSVDAVSVNTDQSRVGELINDIDVSTKVIEEAEKEEPSLEARYAPIATNTATRVNLEVMGDKLEVSNVDTKAFAVQYRVANADYQRLVAQAMEYLSQGGIESDDALETVGEGFQNTSLKLGGNADRFRNARNRLYTCGRKMTSKLSGCRSAADLLQGAIYAARSAAAAAKGKEATKKLAAVRKEIADVAAGVGKVVKICSTIAGLAGGGGETNKLATATAGRTDGGSADIAPSDWAQELGWKTQSVYTPGEQSKAELLKAMGSDVASLGDGKPEKLAESLVKMIGEYANKERIGALQASIAKAAAEEESFKVAGNALRMTGYQEQMQTAASELSDIVEAFRDAKQEVSDAGQELMENLSKQGKKGQNQAKGVLFLGDADRFLAQVETSIAVGENQQENLQKAATHRKELRGTHISEGGNYLQSQYYFRCHKTTVPGKLWGTNNYFKLHKVYVTFQDTGEFGVNDINQGGAGSVEGVGSASDEVAKKIAELKKAKKQVQQLQGKVQSSLGLGAPQMLPT